MIVGVPVWEVSLSVSSHITRSIVTLYVTMQEQGGALDFRKRCWAVCPRLWQVETHVQSYPVAEIVIFSSQS